MISRIVCVEGLVGAGKTALVKEIARENKYKTIFEPVAGYQVFQKHNPLSIMYHSMATESAMVQVHINQVVKRHWAEELGSIRVPGEIVISDRSVYSTDLFSSNLKQQGHMSEFDYDFLAAQVQHTLDCLGLPAYGAHRLFFMDVPIQVCCQRIADRARLGEENHCDAHYLQTLNGTMQDFVGAFRQRKGPANVRVCRSTDLFETKKQLLEFCCSA